MHFENLYWQKKGVKGIKMNIRKGVRGLVLTLGLFLCSCGRDDLCVEESVSSAATEVIFTVDKETEASNDYGQMVSEETEESSEATGEGSVMKGNDSGKDAADMSMEYVAGSAEERSTENAEGTTEAEVSTSPGKEPEDKKDTSDKQEDKGDSATYGDKINMGDGKNPADKEPSKEVTEPSKEDTKPGKEEQKPGQEVVAPPAPSVEQTTPPPVQEEAPVVHTCNYGAGTVTANPTCTAEGTRTFTCSCGASYTETIPATGHTLVTQTQAATCTADGFTKSVCSTCGHVASETTTSATGHAFREVWFPNEPHCTSGGDMHFNYCDTCGYSEDLPKGQPLGHLADEGKLIREATCTRVGLYEHHCVRCGCTMPDTEGTTFDPTKHDWCWDDEMQVMFCTDCHKIEE